MKKLAGKLLSRILMGLGVDMGEFEHKQFIPEEDCYAALQLNHYPPCPNPLMTMGLPSHTDSTFLTILNQGEVAGLEIYRHGEWMHVPPLQGLLVVHVGDMLQVSITKILALLENEAVPFPLKPQPSSWNACHINWTAEHTTNLSNVKVLWNQTWMGSCIHQKKIEPSFTHLLSLHLNFQILSNDKYKSVVHRAITNKAKPRLSIAYLCGPPLHATISPPDEVVKSSFNQQPIYGPTKWIEFLHAKTLHFMGTLDYLKAEWHHSSSFIWCLADNMATCNRFCIIPILEKVGINRFFTCSCNLFFSFFHRLFSIMSWYGLPASFPRKVTSTHLDWDDTGNSVENCSVFHLKCDAGPRAIELIPAPLWFDPNQGSFCKSMLHNLPCQSHQRFCLGSLCSRTPLWRSSAAQSRKRPTSCDLTFRIKNSRRKEKWYDIKPRLNVAQRYMSFWDAVTPN